MTVTTPKLGLPKGEGTDNARDYLKGAISGGGLWKALEVLDNAILSTGGVTLTNPVLLSPTIADFTNAQHAHASAATAGSSLGPGTTLSTPSLTTPAVSGVMTFGGDATLQRTGAGTLQVGAALLAPAGAALTLRTGTGAGTVRASLAQTGALTLTPDATVLGVDISGTGTHLRLTYPAVASNNLRTAVSGEFVIDTSGTDRLRIAQNGTVTLAPNAGAVSLIGTDLYLQSSTGPLKVYANSVGLVPYANNFNSCGGPGALWTAVYATAGAINTSSQDLKEGITPLSPERAMQAVRDTEAVTFDYVAPARGPEWYDLPDDPEQAEAVLQHRLTAAPLEAAARHQHGFVAEQADELFLVGEGQTSPGSSIGVLLAALQQLDQRVQSLEGAA